MSISLSISSFPQNASRKRWLIGVSGGLDSIALLHTLNQAGFSQLIVCHLNHSLRGRASTEDARFVKRMSEELGYTCEISKVDLRKQMAKSSLSLETAGRLARHQFFSECAKKHRCKRLFLAHNMDEQAETVLWNLLRGSQGCRGMQERSEMKMGNTTILVHRPLLRIRKAELETWLRSKRLAWREDASNKINNVARNRIRNEAFPLLQNISLRDITPILAKAAQTDEQHLALMQWALEKAQILDPQGRIHLRTLDALPEVLKMHALAEYLRSHHIANLSTALLQRCLSLLDLAQPSIINLPGGKRLRRREARIFLDDPQPV